MQDTGLLTGRVGHFNVQLRLLVVTGGPGGHFTREDTRSDTVYTDLGLSEGACHHSGQMDEAYRDDQLFAAP